MSELRSCGMCGKKLEWIDNIYGGLVPACTNRQCENYGFPLYEDGLFEDDENAEIAALRQSLAERDAEIERLREALAEIRDLARTGLPPAGWEETYWLFHKSNRIAGMADAALTSVTHWMPLPQPPQEDKGD